METSGQPNPYPAPEETGPSPPATLDTDKTTPATTTFATPVVQSRRSEILTWRFPRPHTQYVLTGRSRAAWHTSFVVPELNLLLDAGLVVNRLRPKHIFLTHGHNDHTMLAPAFVKREDPPDVFCPAEMVGVFDDYINANRMMNLGGTVAVETAKSLFGGEGGRSEEEVRGEVEEEEEEEKEHGDHGAAVGKKTRKGNDRQAGQRSGPGGQQEDGLMHDDGSGGSGALLKTHFTHGVRPGDVLTLPRRPDISVLVLACDHSVPSVGYLFERVTRRLRPDLTSQPAAVLRARRLAGEELTVPHAVPLFAFMGDTTVEALRGEGAAAWLGRGVPVVVTECSFLDPAHRVHAERTKHTLWADLEPIVRQWPATTFVLTHFSLRYSERDVREFFGRLEDAPKNIVVWIDGGEEEG